MTAPVLYNEAAEQAVMSAMLLDPQAITTARELLAPEAFLRPAHTVLFATCAALQDKGDVVDPLTLADHLDAHGVLEKVGGRKYLAYLIDVVPTGANVRYHAQIVRDLADRRHIIRAAQALIEAAEDRSVSLQAAAQDATQALPHILGVCGNCDVSAVGALERVVGRDALVSAPLRANAARVQLISSEVTQERHLRVQHAYLDLGPRRAAR